MIFHCKRVTSFKKLKKSQAWLKTNHMSSSRKINYHIIIFQFKVQAFCTFVWPCFWFNRYEEFHPFLFSQHSKSPYVEFESFDKVCGSCCNWFAFSIMPLWAYFFHLTFLPPRPLMSFSPRWRVRRLTWKHFIRRNKPWKSLRMWERIMNNGWRLYIRLRWAI